MYYETDLDTNQNISFSITFPITKSQLGTRYSNISYANKYMQTIKKLKITILK